MSEKINSFIEHEGQNNARTPTNSENFLESRSASVIHNSQQPMLDTGNPGRLDTEQAHVENVGQTAELSQNPSPRNISITPGNVGLTSDLSRTTTSLVSAGSFPSSLGPHALVRIFQG